MKAKAKRSAEKKPRKRQEPNLGQKESKEQQRSQSELSHMGETSKLDNKDSEG
jgi:hypothetical protein